MKAGILINFVTVSGSATSVEADVVSELTDELIDELAVELLEVCVAVVSDAPEAGEADEEVVVMDARRSC